MPKKTLKSTGKDATITLAYGGSVYTTDTEVNVEASEGHKSWYFDGPALRDALLEAFPLEEAAPSGAADRLADWEKELLAGVKPKQVPGEVYADTARNAHRFVILPDGRYYDLTLRRAYTYSEFATDPLYKRVFDPRDAVALPSPLGIRVGDRVRKTKDGVTISFEVGHIGDGTGHIFAKGDSPNFPVAYNPKGFEVVSREVPDRLPAGTITRVKVNGILCLRLEQGFINLRYNETHPEEDFSVIGQSLENGLKMDTLEVIYLPES